jgi:hypothetical protein
VVVLPQLWLGLNHSIGVCAATTPPVSVLGSTFCSITNAQPVISRCERLVLVPDASSLARSAPVVAISRPRLFAKFHVLSGRRGSSSTWR